MMRSVSSTGLVTRRPGRDMASTIERTLSRDCRAPVDLQGVCSVYRLSRPTLRQSSLTGRADCPPQLGQPTVGRLSDQEWAGGLNERTGDQDQPAAEIVEPFRGCVRIDASKSALRHTDPQALSSSPARLLGQVAFQLDIGDTSRGAARIRAREVREIDREAKIEPSLIASSVCGVHRSRCPKRLVRVHRGAAAGSEGADVTVGKRCDINRSILDALIRPNDELVPVPRNRRKPRSRWAAERVTGAIGRRLLPDLTAVHRQKGRDPHTLKREVPVSVPGSKYRPRSE